MPIPAAALAAGLTAAGNIGGQFIQSGMNKRQAKRAFGYNMKMWRMMNEYNHPAAQMQRYREAGLNPNLMYGQGNAGNAEQMVKYMAPEYKFSMPNVIGMLGQYQNLEIQKEQVKNISADTGVKLSESAIKIIDVEIKRLEQEIKEEEVTWKRSRYGKKRDIGTDTNYQRLQDDLAELQKQRMLLQREYTEKAITFNKYMDFSQVGGILGKVLPFVMDAIKLLILSGGKK